MATSTAHADPIKLDPGSQSGNTVTLESGSTVTVVAVPQTGNSPDLSVSPGWTHAYIRLNQSDQRIAIAGNGAAICLATVIGCVAASGIGASVAQWLMERGGVCPTSRPTLLVQVRYLPLGITGIACTS